MPRRAGALVPGGACKRGQGGRGLGEIAIFNKRSLDGRQEPRRTGFSASASRRWSLRPLTSQTMISPDAYATTSSLAFSGLSDACTTTRSTDLCDRSPGCHGPHGKRQRIWPAAVVGAQPGRRRRTAAPARAPSTATRRSGRRQRGARRRRSRRTAASACRRSSGTTSCWRLTTGTRPVRGSA